MLEIFVSNQKVDLPADIQLSLTIENPMMLSDRIPTPFSLSFTLPPTANNLSIFKHPDRQASFRNASGVISSVPCRILFQSVTIAQGSLITSQYDGGIKASFSGIDNIASVKNVMPSIGLDVLEYPTPNFRDIDFDNLSNYAGQYREMAQDAANGLDDRFVAAPVRVKTDNDPVSFIQYITSRLGTRPRYLRPQEMMNSEYINFWNAATGEFLIRSVEENASRGLWYAFHAPIFPFFRVHYILSSIFRDTLVNNIFSNGELADLVMPTAYFFNWKPRGTSLVYANGYGGMMFDPYTFDTNFAVDFTISLNQFLPALESPDWFRGLLKLFCISTFNNFGKFEIVANKDVLAAPLGADWDAKLIGSPVLRIEKGKTYKYGYRDEEEYSPGDNVTTVANMNDLLNFPSTDPGDELDTVMHVSSTGQYFERHITHVEGEDSEDPGEAIISFHLLDAGYGGIPDDTEATDAYDSVAEIKPLPLIPKEYWTTPRNMPDENPPTKYWWLVPYSEDDRTARPSHAYIGFFRGIVSGRQAGHSYPLVSPYNINPDGTPNGDYTLCWGGEDGLLENFHAEYKEWIEKDKVRMQGSFLLTALDFNNMDLKKKVHVRGGHFFIERIQVTIRHNRIDPAVIDLIEV